MKQDDKRDQQNPKEGQDKAEGKQDADQEHRPQGQDKSKVDKAEQANESGNKEDHAAPQSKKSIAGTSLPENKLSEHERKWFAGLDNEDKELFKAYFGRVKGGKPQAGQKNW